MGSKKKKAAKRRQEIATSNIHSPPTNSEPEGYDDLGTHDEKEEISGNNSSTTSQGEKHDQLIEEKKDSSDSVGLSKSDNIPMLGGSENGGENPSKKKPEEVVVRDLKTEGDSDSGTVCIEYVKSAKESGNGGSSSDSSSDEESQLVEKIQSSVMEESEEFKEGVKINNNPVDDVVPPIDLMAEIVSPLAEKTCTLVEEIKTQVVLVTKVEKIEGSSPTDSPSKEINEKMLPPTDVPSVNAGNGGEHTKEAETPESSQKQQEQVAIVPPVAQPTSWKSCCGLFEVLTGSDR